MRTENFKLVFILDQRRLEAITCTSINANHSIIPLRSIRKECRSLRYLAYRTFCSSTTFEGTSGDAASKTLAFKYEAVLQKIGLECIKFSARLQKFWYGSGFTTQILAILL